MWFHSGFLAAREVVTVGVVVPHRQDVAWNCTAALLELVCNVMALWAFLGAVAALDKPLHVLRVLDEHLAVVGFWFGAL